LGRRNRRISAPHQLPRSWKKSYTSFAVTASSPGVFSGSNGPALATSLTEPKANRARCEGFPTFGIKISGTIFPYDGANAISASCPNAKCTSWRWYMTTIDKVEYLQLVDCNGLSSQAGEEKMSAPRRSGQLIGNACLGFVETAIFESQRQFLVGHVSTFEFCL
jgi:hypothetical protein